VGEIRRLLRDRLDVDPRSDAVLDGNDVSDEVVVGPGQTLRFVRRSGEKGTTGGEGYQLAVIRDLFNRVGRRGSAPKPRVAIEGAEAVATSPEGESARLSLDQLLSKIGPQSHGTGDVILPDGVKAVIGNGATTLWVHETPPGLHRLVWIAADSPVPFGKGAIYRNVTLSLPYLIIFCIFEPGPGGMPVLSHANECFFRNAPLKSFDDELHYPALLNCSKFARQANRPLSWICTQYLTPDAFRPIANPAERFQKGFNALKHCLLETGFNYSSEEHEASSWFTESRTIDPRVNTVEAWEEASAKDPLFALEVPWLPTQHTVRQAAQRVLQRGGRGARPPLTSATLARIIFNSAKPATSMKPVQLNLAAVQ
jgi:hypothetical protein